MISIRPKHTEPSSTDPTGGDTIKARALEASEPKQSESAAMKTTALGIDPERLMEQIVDQANIEQAWKNVRRNRGAPGPDGVTIAAFREVFRSQWPTVRQQLLDGTYQPLPARRKSIPKDDGSERHLGIPNILERLIQQSIMQILTPIFDPGRRQKTMIKICGRPATWVHRLVRPSVRQGIPTFTAELTFSATWSCGLSLVLPCSLSTLL